jgi:Dyp-type peroxidase family
MVAKPRTSKHLRTSTELSLVAPIQPRFVQTASNESVPMATRLGALLGTFFELRKAAVERSLDGTAGPLESMRTLNNFCWSVFDGGQKLLLTVTFDRPWEPYIRSIVDLAGPFLDAIFCHCTGYEGCSTEHGYVPFAGWVRQRQIDVSLFYSAEPDLTVDDQRYLRELERMLRDGATRPDLARRIATLALGEPGRTAIAAELLANADRTPSRVAADERLGRAAAALVSLRELFHTPAGDAEAERARRFFDGAGWLMLEPIAGQDGIERLPERLGDAVREMRQASIEARRRAPDTDARAAVEVERARIGRDVQANILTSYAGMTHGCAVLLGFDGAAAARAFVGLLAAEVTPHEDAEAARLKVNVALTYQGFRTLGLSEAELESFPSDFREGMAARAGLLGDVGPEHPDNWDGPRWGGIDAAPGGRLASPAEIDALLLLQVPGPVPERPWGPEHPLYRRLQQLVAASGVRVIGVLPLQRELETRPPCVGAVKEHFGYVDGVSQPVAAPWANGAPARDHVALGELLLGYRGDRGGSERYPMGPELYTRDGSFLVVRQLEQDVEAFEAFIDENAGAFAGGREALYTKLMGRQRDGWSPISTTSVNEFDYSQDPLGERCPLASHVRRSNPRAPSGVSVHGLELRGPRIARRGFSYGPLSGSSERGPRGLLFMAFNASLAEQFEVIQRWLNGANSTGVLSAHADPIVSHRSGQVLTLMDGNEPRHLLKQKPFVKLIWGAYFFAPSKPALAALARLDSARPGRDEEARAHRGAEMVEQLSALDRVDAERAMFAWKRLLEDRLSREARESAGAVWSCIRSRYGGVLRTRYGVLVGAAGLVRRVLGDEACFSVGEYGRRMTASVGLLHLGMDRCPVAGHDAASTSASSAAGPPTEARYHPAGDLPNAFMASLSRDEAMLGALPSARHHFERLGPYVELSELAKCVLTDMSRRWFGLPRDRAGYDVFHTAALAIFCPNPEAAVVEAAARLGQGLRGATDEALSQEPPPLAAYLGEAGFGGDVAAALIGGAQGTLAATVGSFLSVARYCLDNQRLGRLVAWLASAEGEAWRADPSARARAGDAAPIVHEALAALYAQPMPELLHRTVVAPTVLGGVELVAGERVVVSLGSALADGLPEHERRALLFGGEYPATGDGPKHACPGREAALGVILALLLTLIENDVRREGLLRVSRRA